MQTFRGRTLVLRALRPIGSGEEIRVTYLDLALSAPEQRRRLQEQCAAAGAAENRGKRPAGRAELLARRRSLGRPSAVGRYLTVYFFFLGLNCILAKSRKKIVNI